MAILTAPGPRHAPMTGRDGLSWLLLLALAGCRAAPNPPSSQPVAEDPPLVAADSLRAAYLVAGRAVVDSALASRRDTAPACVSFVAGRIHYRAEPADLQRLVEPHRRYIARTQCPHTYTSMIGKVDSLGRPVDRAPRGYVDPHHLEITVPGRWTNDRLDIEVSVAQGTRIDKYLCLTRFRAGVPVVSCRHVSTIYS